MFSFTAVVVLFVSAAGPKKDEPKKDDAELKAKIAAITKQLASKKTTDVVAGLEAAGKLGKAGEPLIQKICEVGVFSKNDEVAAAGADAIKEIAPAIHETVLKLRTMRDPTYNNVVYKLIEGLESDGVLLLWEVQTRMSKDLVNYPRMVPDQDVKQGFKTLRALGDKSEQHWLFVLKCKAAKGNTNVWSESYDLFIKADPSKLLTHVKGIINQKNTYTQDDIKQIVSIGKDAKDALPRLRSMSKLSTDKELRESALIAIEKIEAAIKEAPKK